MASKCSDKKRSRKLLTLNAKLEMIKLRFSAGFWPLTRRMSGDLLYSIIRMVFRRVGKIV
jgi:hypothetical protein